MLKRLLLKATAALLGVSLVVGSGAAYPPPVKPAKPIKPMPAKPIKPMPAKPIKPIAPKPGVPKPGMPKPGLTKPGFPKHLPPSVKKFVVPKHQRHLFTHHRLHPRFGFRVFWHPLYRCWFYWSPEFVCYLPVQYISTYPPAELAPPVGPTGPVDPTGPIEPPDPDQ